MYPPIYPQLDFANAGNPHVSSALADMVCGDFSFEGMDHMTRVNRLTALIKLYKLVRELGDLEHTGDWDWRVTLTCADTRVGSVKIGTTYDDPDGTKDSWADAFWLDYEVERQDYADDFARWHDLTIEIFPPNESGEAYNRILAIDSLISVHIEMA